MKTPQPVKQNAPNVRQPGQAVKQAVAPAMPAAKEESLWKWFHPVNWCAAFVTFCSVLATYVYTLQPTVGLEDSGELVTGAYRIGVPHPPGYPTWAMLGKLFSLLIPFGDPAFRVNMVSAVCGALAAGMLTLVLSKTGDLFFGEEQKELGLHHLHPLFERFGLTTPRLVNALCAIPCGILFAFTPGTWSQCTIAEAYPLNVLNMALIVVLSLVMMFNPHRRDVMCWIAFVYGLGIINHQTIALVVFGVIWLAFATQKDPRTLKIRGPDLYTIAVIFLLVSMIVAVVTVSHGKPTKEAAVIALLFLGAIGLTVWAWLERKPYEHFTLLTMNGLLLMGFTMCMFSSKDVGDALGIRNMPDLRLLPFNGGDPDKVPLHERLVFNFFVLFIGPFLAYVAVIWYANKKLFNETDWWKWVASFFAGLAFYFYLPIASASNPQMNWARSRTVEGFWHSILRGQYEKPSFSRSPEYFISQVWLYLKDTWDQYPMVLLFAFISMIGLVAMWRRERVRNWIIYSIITLVFCGMGMVFLMNPKLDITSQYINRVFFILGHAGLGLLIGYGMLVVVSALFALSHRDEEWRQVGWLVGVVVAAFGLVFAISGLLFAAHITVLPDKWPAWLQLVHRIVNINVPLNYAWLFLLFFGAVFTSIGLLVLCGLHNHAKCHAASIIMACLLMTTPLISAIENWGEVNLRAKYFGYIFGEEMLKVCEPDTVFFGGTDPGRFVPEYLIGCNQFRGDIWLITQNGLADATYMNTLRDRYCKVQPVWPRARTLLRWFHAEREDPLRNDPKSRDPKRGTIYIPSQQDFERAFQIYLEEVQERKKRGEPIEEDVQIQGGKISVGGVAGVMRLNGILAKMIFDQNTNRHAFYVEESYVINWMYPYLKPAGLIMKLCKDPVTITPAIVSNDFAYWNNLTNMFDNGGMIEYDDVVALYWRELKQELKDNPAADRTAVVSNAWSRAVMSSKSVGGMWLDTMPSHDYLDMLYEQCKEGQTVEFTQERGRVIIRPGEFADDEPAQKSFSKARSAIAGVYEFHNMWNEASNAYIQSLWLYPKSAEAYMRLASMYMKIGRFDDALVLAEDYKRMDPLNDRVDGMVGAIKSARDQNREFTDLQQRFIGGTNMVWQDYLKLINLYEGRGMRDRSLQLCDYLLSTQSPVTNAQMYHELKSLFSTLKDGPRLVLTFKRLTTLNPKDWEAWIDYGKMNFAMNDSSACFACIETALGIDPEKARRRLIQDQQLDFLRNNPDPAVKERFLGYIK